MGDQPDNLTPRVQDLIETLTGERPAFAKLEAATAHLAQVLSDQDMLTMFSVQGAAQGHLLHAVVRSNQWKS